MALERAGVFVAFFFVTPEPALGPSSFFGRPRPLLVPVASGFASGFAGGAGVDGRRVLRGGGLDCGCWVPPRFLPVAGGTSGVSDAVVSLAARVGFFGALFLDTLEPALGPPAFFGRPGPLLVWVSRASGGGRAGMALALPGGPFDAGWEAVVEVFGGLPLRFLLGASSDGGASAGRFMPAILALRRGGD